MTSIGRFVVAGAAATQDSTLALASINFDFSLVKMEAPLEYRGLGSALSSKRKRDAEEGSTHITARKLGALFADDLPHTPSLSRAYGLRVSEIAENPTHNPHGTTADGPFVDNIGADGTSIWAAATSGCGALAVHLLACMLARVWSSPEAVSIWSEIIAARKSVLQARVQEREFHIGMITACQIDIDREKLAEWDASARSWLRTGDAAMKLRQTQLMLIVDNIDLPMPSKITVYDEVMNIWTQAMIMADKLVSGVPQSVQSGDVLLGLCAWHIYPDICAIGLKTTMIEQHDRLVKKGGLVTIGLRSAGEDGNGVSWSMPLAHLRFYGKAVMSHALIGSTSSRATFNRIIQITMGCLTSAWENPYFDLTDLAKFLTVFDTSLQHAMKMAVDADTTSLLGLPSGLTRLRDLIERLGGLAEIESRGHWPSLLSRKAQEYLDSSKDEQREIARYVALGRRRYGIFLAEAENHPSPHFGLSDSNLFIQLIRPEKRVDQLRAMAKLFTGSCGLDSAIIRLIHPKDSLGHRMFEYATLFPQVIEGTSRKTHRRWIVFPGSSDPAVSHRPTAPFSKSQRQAIWRSVAIMRYSAEPCGFLHHRTFASSFKPSDYTTEFSWVDTHGLMSVRYMMDHTDWVEELLPAEQKRLGWQMGHLQHVYEGTDYRYLYGGNTTAAVYRSCINWLPVNVCLPAQYVMDGLATQDFDPHLFADHFAGLIYSPFMESDASDYFRSLIALAQADRIYATLPQAEIDLAIFTRILCSSKWAQASLSPVSTRNDRIISLSCISLFDTGFLDLQIVDLEGVIAISSANSLYASEFLFLDPYQSQSSHCLRHVVDNVGKPGLALLLSPRDTILREPDLDTWQLVNHSRFDGSFEDSFASTTLHLSLTGYEQQLNTQRYGCRDKEAFYLEAVVSAYDKGIWVADLDLLHLLKSPNLFLSTDCAHDTKVKEDYSAFPDLTAIDIWYEYLDRQKLAKLSKQQASGAAGLVPKR